MADSNVIDRLHGDCSALERFLDEEGGELAFRCKPVIDEHLPKTMLLAAASHFERRLSDEVELLAKDATAENHIIVSLIKNKVISRQYHTWFSWDKGNANTFFSMFGQGFKKQAAEWVRSDEKLNKSVVDFLEIGQARNHLAHGHFGEFILEKTASEVYALYQSAAGFVDWFPRAIRDYSEGSATMASSP